MPTQPYYLDGTTLSNSNAIYANAALTICAADGFYSDGTISREQVSCGLLAEESCPSCAQNCSTNIISTVGFGTYTIYLLDVNVGQTVLDLGAIKVSFSPDVTPEGFRATYNGVVYNKLSSPVDGYHASTVSTNFTVVGAPSGFTCITGLPSLNTYEEFKYDAVTNWSATGNFQNIALSSGDLSPTSPSGSPGDCVMVIPKTTAAPAVISFEILGPCTGIGFDIVVECPRILTSFAGGTQEPTQIGACAIVPQANAYYNMPVTGSYGVPALNDWVFADSYGANILGNGFYSLAGNRYMEVANGVIVDINNC
tara:strand:+ start:1218 stop:2150 length:933 start_codon:yes stop_codon:yes gene_type:complete